MDDSERAAGNQSNFHIYKKQLQDALDKGLMTKAEFDECEKLLYLICNAAESRKAKDASGHKPNRLDDIKSRAVPVEMANISPQVRAYFIPAKTSNKIEPKKLRTAAYCRVSTEKDEQKASLESQVHAYTNMIKDNPEWSFSGVFVDDGMSATNVKGRKGFQKMIKLCEKGD